MRESDSSARDRKDPCGVWVDSVLDGDASFGPSSQPYLILSLRVGHEADEARVVPIGSSLEIGREGQGSTGRLVLPSRRVSRNHARIVARGTEFEIHDLNSSNGTYVGGSRVAGARLARDGALVVIGPHAMFLRFLSSEALEAIQEDQRVPLVATPTLNGRLALIHRSLRSYAPRSEPLLITGGAGTGKGTYARAVHENSGRPGPWVAVDGRAFDNSDEQTFCAHWESSIRNVTDGTLYVEAIDYLPLGIQKRLASMCESTRGGRGLARRLTASARIVASMSSSSDPNKPSGASLCGELRETFDLQVRLPALVRRKEDLGTLCRHLFGQRPRWRFTDQAWLAMCLYDWPRNVCELSTTLEQLLLEFATNDDLVITQRNLPEGLRRQIGYWLDTEAADAGTADTAVWQTPNDDDVGGINLDEVVVEFGKRHSLSARQAQIVAGALRGLSSKEIAAELEIDYRTVAEHLGRVCEKVGAADRHQLIARVIDLLIKMLSATAR
jgi:pSer/pThr/pTyr-binding forkhead associated (FHA) protein/DNA-binding CsgD family transcriptional regulator